MTHEWCLWQDEGTEATNQTDHQEVLFAQQLHELCLFVLFPNAPPSGPCRGRRSGQSCSCRQQAPARGSVSELDDEEGLETMMWKNCWRVTVVFALTRQAGSFAITHRCTSPTSEAHQQHTTTQHTRTAITHNNITHTQSKTWFIVKIPSLFQKNHTLNRSLPRLTLSCSSEGALPSVRRALPASAPVMVPERQESNTQS